MRPLAWLPVPALALLAACGSIPQTFIDAGGTGTCAPACDTNATCTGTTCACNSGYTGDGVTCADVNECTATANGGCDANATCTNVPGTRTCSCLPGFIGDGVACRQTWRLVGTLPGLMMDPENFGARATAVGARIFFRPEADTPTNVYFRSFDTSTNAFSGDLAFPPNTNTGSPPRVGSDFCACGLTEAFVGDGTGISVLGNDGQRYDVAANRWIAVTSYQTGAKRGEAAASYDARNDLLLLVGGRDNTPNTATNASHLVVGSSSYGGEPGVLPGAGADSAVAWTLSSGNVTYVAGGDTSGGRQLLSYATGSGVWKQLADAPANLGRPTGMGEFMGKLWVSTRNTFYFFDPAAQTWRATPLDGPSGFILAVTASTGTYAFAQNGANLEVHQLVNIE